MKSFENVRFLRIADERKFINKPQTPPLAPSAAEILSLFPLKSERLERKAGIRLIYKDGLCAPEENINRNGWLLQEKFWLLYRMGLTIRPDILVRFLYLEAECIPN